MATTVTPLPQLDRTAPDFRQQTNLFFGSQLPTFTVQINQVSFELMTARDQTVAARDEAVPLANQVITLAPQAIAASNNVSVLAPQVAQNAQIAETARANAVAAAAQATAVNMGGSTGWPLFPPTQLNDWANSRYLSTAFSRQRSSTATYIDRMGRLRTAASGEPVFEWDTTGRCRGLRVEPARTNTQIQSENFMAAGWGLTAATLSADVRIAPNGAMTMDKLVETASTGEHGVLANTQGPVSAGALWCYSIFAAPGERRYLRLLLPSAMYGSNMQVIFDLLNGVIAVPASAGATAGIVPAGNGCWRVWISAAVAITGNQNPVQLRMCEVTGTASYVGDGASGLFIWGGQFEAGSSPTSYIPTTAAAVTRPADVITLPAAAAAEVLNPAQGAFVVEFTLNAVPSGAGVYQFVFAYSNGTGNEILLLRVQSGSLFVYVVSGGVQRAELNLGAAIVGQRYRVAIGYSVTQVRLSINGAAIVAGTFGTPAAGIWDRLDVGASTGISQLNGHIASLLPYSRIPSDSSLITMSSL